MVCWIVPPANTGQVQKPEPRPAPGQAPTKEPSRAEQKTPDSDEQLEPDQPDVTNGTHVVPIGRLQLEFGGHYSRVTSTGRSFGSPITVRVGLLDWLEARIGTDGFVGQRDTGARATGMGNVQLGAKVVLWSDPGGIPVLAILPAVTVPVASVRKGLGTGSTDPSITFLTGTDLGQRNHIDFNYSIGRIGSGQGLGHFAQHLVSASASRRLGEHANPYWEVYWISKQEPDGGHVGSTDFGIIYTLGPRFALDGGVDVGFTKSAQRLTCFGGFSVIIGDILGSHGVHARQRKAQERAIHRTTRRR